MNNLEDQKGINIVISAFEEQVPENLKWWNAVADLIVLGIFFYLLIKFMFFY